MDESFNQSPFSAPPSSSPQVRGGRGKKLFFLILVLLVLAGIAFGAFQFLGNSTKTPTPTPTQELLPTETPTPTASTSGTPTPTIKGVKITPTLTPKVTPKVTGSTSGLDRSTLTVNVQNGSGATGAGKKMGDTLTSLGYTLGTVENADNTNFTTTEIHVKSTKSNYLTQLKKDLGATYTIGTAAADYTGTGDALVIVGKE